MPETDLELLIAAARAAGKVAVEYANRGAKSWDKAEGAGPVTEADLAVNALLGDRLRSARPEYGWLSEESEDTDARLSLQKLFIVDPIDGTRSFIEGSDTWAHSLAVAEGREITAAVVYLPARDRIYTAERGKGAYFNGQPIRASDIATLEGASLLAAKPALKPEHWAQGVPPVKRGFRPSLAYRLALVAQGRFDAMLTVRKTWEWDIAAGSLICQEAGAQVSDRSGARLLFNNPEPRVSGIVAAGPKLHTALVGALAD